MLEKIITVAARVIIICLAAEAVRQIWNPNEDDKEKDKKENK